MNVARVTGDWSHGSALLTWCETNISPALVWNTDGWVGTGWVIEYHGDYWQIEIDDPGDLTVFLLRWA